MGPKFQSISLYGQPFSSNRPLWDNCTEWPQHDLEHQKFKGTSYTYYYYSRLPDFTPFYSTANSFPVTSHFETSAPNDLQMTLDAKRSKLLRTHVTTTPKSQISLCFAILPAAFELHTILGLVIHEYFQNCYIWAWNWAIVKNSRSCAYTLFLPQGLEIELIFALWAAVSEMRAGFQNCNIWTWILAIGQISRSCTYTPSITPDPYPHPESQIALRFAPGLAISKILAIFHFPIVTKQHSEVWLKGVHNYRSSVLKFSLL